MRQRLGLAEILLKRPELIIMDEPTLGLDPEAAREFLATIRGLKAEGITVLLSSHLLPQVQAICDRVGLFNHGQLAIEGTVADLARHVLGGAYRVHLEAEGPPELDAALRRIDGVVGVVRPGPHIYAIEAIRDLRPDVARAVVETGGQLLALDIETPSLDEIYTRYFQEVEHVVAA
jgi:ABC-2 type transport system ATP-binding protein